MNCADARENFSGWVDETLAPEERAALASHLAECSDCRRELDRFQATVGLLQRVAPARAPAGFVDRVLDLTRPMSWRRRLLQRLFLPLPVKLPAEAAALLLVAGLAVYVFHQTPELQQAARPPEVSQPAARVDAPAAPAPAQAVAPRDARQTTQLRAPSRLRGSVDLGDRGPIPPHSEEELAKTPVPAAPPGAASVPPALSVDAKKEARTEGPGVPGASEPAPAAPGPAPAMERRADSARQKTSGAPQGMTQSSSAMRVSPSVDVVGRLTVTDRAAALRALVELLVRVRGAEVSRRDESGATVVDLVVPAAGYVEFSRGLAGIGAWLSSAEPAELPAQVRVTLRLAE